MRIVAQMIETIRDAVRMATPLNLAQPEFV
jgi:hypothetical protein